MRQAGLIITPRAVFEHPTVGALAKISRPAQEIVSVEPDIAIGAVMATPIIRWLQERKGPIGRFNQAMLLQLPAGVQHDHLAAALQAILERHDALRLRLDVTADEDWQLQISSPEAELIGSCLRRVDVSGLDPDALRACIVEEARGAEARLAPTAGQMLQAVWFDGGDRQTGRLLLTIYHLAVDGVSWRILLPDLSAAIAAIERGNKPAFGPPGTSLRRWSHLLVSEASTPQRVAELGFWSGLLKERDDTPIEGLLDAERDLAAMAGQFTLTLPPAITELLSTRVPAAFHGGINDVLLTGLAVALAQWCRRQGRGAGTSFLLNVEGHGREAIAPDVDLSRTVGWFTSIYPVRLDLGSLDVDEAMRGGPALARAFKLIKEQLRAVPNHGLGYGLLRYLNSQTGALLSGFATPRIGFNYLGRFPAAHGRDWSSAEESDVIGGGYDPGMPLAHALEINAVTLDGREGSTLSATLSWAPALITDEEVRAVAQDWFRVLEALVDQVQSGAGGRTPSDLPLVRLSQAQIERIETLYPQTEDILPLSPLQEGLLFHALYDVQGPDTYTLQVVFGIDGALDSEALHAAANLLVQRHANLRASFQHENSQSPRTGDFAGGTASVAQFRSVAAGPRKPC